MFECFFSLRYFLSVDENNTSSMIKLIILEKMILTCFTSKITIFEISLLKKKLVIQNGEKFLMEENVGPVKERYLL